MVVFLGMMRVKTPPEFQHPVTKVLRPEQYVLDVTSEYTALNRSTDGDHLIRIDPLLGCWPKNSATSAGRGASSHPIR